MDATVVIGTFGSQVWPTLAKRRAIPSARRQGCRVIHEHRDTLAQARNAALEQVETEFVIHLDADDELTPGYVEAMLAGSADLRVPAVTNVFSKWKEVPPHFPRVYGHKHDCVGECLRSGNWIVVGACVRAELAQGIGWEEFGWSEDWALWARCWKAGATIERVPDAVYRAFRRMSSRNRIANRVSVDWHRKIEAAVWPEEESVL